MKNLKEELRNITLNPDLICLKTNCEKKAIHKLCKTGLPSYCDDHIEEQKQTWIQNVLQSIHSKG